MSISEPGISPSFDVFGLGQCALDYLGKIEAFPQSDSKCEFNNLTVQGGGPVATALVALTRWGLSCTFSGVLGDDAFGEQIKSDLKAEGVDTAGLVVRENAGSQFAFILAEPTVAHRTIFWRRPTGDPLKPNEIDMRLLAESKLLHTDGLFVDASLEAARAAQDNGVPVVVDAGTLREGMLELARSSDYFVASEKFGIALAGDPKEACLRLAELGPRLSCVTLGSRGYVAVLEGRLFERPAHPVEAVDTTGCGDIFHAGLSYGLVQGWDVEKCLDFGAWAASRVSLKLGGRAGIPDLKEWKSD